MEHVLLSSVAVGPRAVMIGPEALIDLPLVKQALGIAPDNTTEDELLVYLINVAAARLESDAQRPLAWRARTESFDGPTPPHADLRLPLYPVTRIQALTAADGQVLTWWLVDREPRPATIDVYIYPTLGFARRLRGWPQGLATITLQWEGGYAAPIPGDLQEASILMVADGYQTRKLGTWNSANLTMAGQTVTLAPDQLWRRYRTCLAPYQNLRAG